MLGLVKFDTRPAVEGPAFWLVAFHETVATGLLRFVPGRFKHVSAIAFLPEAKSWVLVDPTIYGTRVAVYADTNSGLNELAKWIDDALVVRMPAVSELSLRAGRARGPGMWCVPIVRKMLGLRSGALLPDGLLRDCLANGGVVAAEPGDTDGHQNAESAA